MDAAEVDEPTWRIAHLTTADISLALLLSTELAEARAAGHTVIGISAPGPYVERVEAIGVEHVPVTSLSRSWGLRRDVLAFVELFRVIRSLDLDVLHTHNPKTGVMGRIAGRLARVPVVVNTCHGLWATPEDRRLKRWLVYGLEGLAIQFSDFELFQNAQDAQTLRRFLKRGRYRVVGNGIDLERFRFDAEGRARLRREWGIAGDELLVGTVGRRVREKGLSEYASVARALGDRARFVWVGPEDETDALASDGIDVSTVQFIGEHTDMAAVYSAFDVFVLASYREGFSRASMEAAACGRPLVLSDIRGCREIGEHETHLLLATPKDAAALRVALERLLDDAALRDRLGAAARTRAHQVFDQRAIARISRDTYRRVLSRSVDQRRYARLKRGVDIVASAAVLTASLPAQAGIALAIRCRMGSPVLFRQPRPGKDGVVFELVKFRTMRRPDATHVTDEERLTALGRFLRSTSLDELPTLWNVVRGDMSLVGPRPLLVEYLPLYSTEQARRHEVRPGVTGLAQVSGRNAISWDEKLRLDVEYVDRAGPRLDAWILLKTIGNVLRRTGISADGHATTEKFGVESTGEVTNERVPLSTRPSVRPGPKRPPTGV